MNIHNLIVQLREDKGYSTTKLAKLAGLAQSTLREIELGNTSPTWDTINKLCQALEVTPLTLLSEVYAESQEQKTLSSDVVSVMEIVKRMSTRQVKILLVMLGEWKIEEHRRFKSTQSNSKEGQLKQYRESISLERRPRGTREDIEKHMEELEKNLKETKVETRRPRRL